MAAWESHKTSPIPATVPDTSLLGGESIIALGMPAVFSGLRRQAGLPMINKLREFKVIRAILRLQGLPFFPFGQFD